MGRSWLSVLVNGQKSTDEVAMTFFHSSELRSRGLSNGEFVEAVYQALLDREPDSHGFAMWTLALDIGLDRDQMVRKVLRSSEFRLK